MAEVIFDNVPDDVLHAVVEFWHFKEGDHIDEGDDLVDLRGDNNTSFTITSPVTGVLTSRLYGEDDEVEIGEVLAEIDEDIEDLDEDEEDLDLDEFEEEEEELPEEELEEEPDKEEFEEEEDDDKLDSDEEDDF